MPENTHEKFLGMALLISGLPVLTNARIQKIFNELGHTVKRLSRETAQVKEGMKTLMRALILNRISDSLPHNKLTLTEESQISAFIKTEYKAALKVPIFMVLEKVLELCLYNTFEDTRKATLLARMKRLLK